MAQGLSRGRAAAVSAGPLTMEPIPGHTERRRSPNSGFTGTNSSKDWTLKLKTITLQTLKLYDDFVDLKHHALMATKYAFIVCYQF